MTTSPYQKNAEQYIYSTFTSLCSLANWDIDRWLDRSASFCLQALGMTFFSNCLNSACSFDWSLLKLFDREPERPMSTVHMFLLL